jgi:hypothetical protein
VDGSVRCCAIFCPDPGCSSVPAPRRIQADGGGRTRSRVRCSVVFDEQARLAHPSLDTANKLPLQVITDFLPDRIVGN